jgi:hypothetical protein
MSSLWIETLSTCGITLVTPMLIGVPLMLVLRRRALEREDWLLAPFLGCAALVLVLQNCVYLDVPVARQAPWVWALVALVWLGIALHAGARRRLRASSAAFPRALVLLALLAFGTQGAALLMAGARFYVGRSWEDHFSYTMMAQFFQDERFSLRVGGIGARPYLFRVLRPSMGRFAITEGLKENRIGQSLVQAFGAATLRSDAKTLFGPTSLLGVALLVLAVGLVAGRLGLPPPAVLLAAWSAALLPGFTILHLESFLSHSLVLAFFLAWLIALDDLGREPGVRRGVAAALVLAFGIATYSEMWTAFLALAVVALGLHAVRARPIPCLLALAALLVSSYATNPRYVGMLLLTAGWADTPLIHTAIYPWAYTLAGQARLWFGDVGGLARGNWALLASWLGLATTCLGLAGLVSLVVRAWRVHGLRRASTGSGPSLALCASLLALVLGALPFLLSGRHPYQFYKVLQTGSPALVLGCVALLWRWRGPGRMLAALLACTLTVASLEMVLPAAGTRPQARSNAGLLLPLEVRELQEHLRTRRGEALVIAPGLLPALNAWVAYFARHESVWLATPWLSRDRLARSPEAAPLLDLTRVPAEALVLSRRDDRAFARPPADMLWANAAFELWRPRPGPWAILFDVDQPGEQAEARLDGTQPWLGRALTPVRGRLRLRVLAGQAGNVRVVLAHSDVGAPTVVLAGCRNLAPAAAANQPAPRVFACEVRAGFNDLQVHVSPAAELRVLSLEAAPQS